MIKKKKLGGGENESEWTDFLERFPKDREKES